MPLPRIDRRLNRRRDFALFAIYSLRTGSIENLTSRFHFLYRIGASVTGQIDKVDFERLEEDSNSYPALELSLSVVTTRPASET